MTSRTKRRHRMRCVATYRCGQRFTLRRHPESYKRDRYVCPSCGGRAYSDEQNRRNELAKQERCHCNGVPFPHRKGSILGCDHHPVDPLEWSPEQEAQYEAMLAVPRSG